MKHRRKKAPTNPGPAARLRAPAIGFDLGETLWHYVRWPLGAVEAWKPVLTRGRRCREHRRRRRRRRRRPGSPQTSRRAHAAASRDQHAGRLRRHAACPRRRNRPPRRDRRPHVLPTSSARTSSSTPTRVATLAELKRRGFKVGALTNVPYGMPRATIQGDLERTGLAPHHRRAGHLGRRGPAQAAPGALSSGWPPASRSRRAR